MGRAIVLISPSQAADGLQLVDASDRAHTDPAFPRVLRALELISKQDPKRYARLHRDLKRILVFTETGPEYWPELRACVLNRRSVDQESAIGLATTIVHEATHARLWHAGHRYPEHLRARVEQICTRAEVGFLRTIPGTEALVERVVERSTEEWWSEDALTKRYAEKLGAVGAPRWVVNLFQRLRALRRG